jgi:hypothetical protein
MVRKGESVAYSVYVMHRRKDLYGSDADVFRPERWDPDEDNEMSLKNIGWGYLPFNGGPRVCLGRKHSSSLPQFLTESYDRRICVSGGLLHHRQIAADIQEF